MNWRIVVNDQSGRYRIETRHWWGWEFVTDEDGQYLSFDDCEQAKRWACQHLRRRDPGYRRWRIVDWCKKCPSV